MSRHQLAAWTLITVGVGALTYSVAHAQKASDTPTLTAADYVEIQMLVARYGFALDTGTDDGYMYADLFAPGGTFIKTTGRDELAKLSGFETGVHPGPVTCTETDHQCHKTPAWIQLVGDKIQLVAVTPVKR